MLAVIGVAAGATVMLATRLGMPTSTTHALIGALVGASLVANADGINWSGLANKFAQPLLLSPLLAIGLTLLFYPMLHRLRLRSGIDETSCLCVGEIGSSAMPSGVSAAILSEHSLALAVAVTDKAAQYVMTAVSSVSTSTWR